MNLEEKLNNSLNDILRTSGYVFEIINNNKRQSNLITGPNSQLIPPPMMEQLAQKIAGFELILDETVSKFNDTPWCIDQIIQNKKKQEEQKIQEELERQQRAEEEKKRKEEEEALAEKKRKQEEEEKLALERERIEQEERDRKVREEAEEQAQIQAQNKQNIEYSPINDPQNQHNQQNQQNQQGDLSQQYSYQDAGQGSNDDPLNGSNDLLDPSFDLDMDGDKSLDIPNPSDILSMNFKDDLGGDMESANGNMPNTDNGSNMDIDSVMKGDDALLDDFNMDLLGEDFGEGLGNPGEEEFDVENFLNQFGNGD